MARIPNNMTEVLFISGHGDEYIETDIHLDSDCIVRSRWSFNGTAACIYGCFTTSASTDNFCLYGGSHSADSYIRFDGQLVRDFRPTSGTVYSFEHSSEGFFVNGTKIASFEPATFTCSAPLRIFGLPNSRYAPISGRCYGFQILKRSEIDTATTETLYYFVPVKNEDTGEVGMFETVEGNFYGNSGGGSFSPSSTIVSRPIAGSISNFRRRLMMASVTVEEYIQFEDPVVEQICATKWGDGIGLKPSQAARVTSIGTTFKGNTNIVYFNELKYFTGLTSLNEEAFHTCSNLKEVTLPVTVTTIGGHAFRYASRLSILIHDGVENANAGDVILPYLTGFGASNAIFQEAYGLKNVKDLGSITATPYQVFLSCSNLVSIVLPSTVTSIGGQLIQNTGVMTIVCHATTPPTVGSNAFRTGAATKRVTVYVPYSADHSILAAYQSAPGWSGNGYGGGLKQILELDENGNIPE